MESNQQNKSLFSILIRESCRNETDKRNPKLQKYFPFIDSMDAKSWETTPVP